MSGKTPKGITLNLPAKGIQQQDPGLLRERVQISPDSLSGVDLGTCAIAQVSSEIQPAVYGTEWKGQKYFVKMKDTFVKVPG